MHDFALDLHYLFNRFFAKEMLKNIRCSYTLFKKKFVTLRLKQ